MMMHPPAVFSSSLLQTASISQTLAELVRIDSVNPSYGGPEGGERRVAQWAAAFLERAGLKPTLSEALPGRPNLRVRLRGQADVAPLLFETHIDTVSVAGMTIDPFAATVRDGCLWGRGATDAKAQAATILHALAAWASSPVPPPRPIEVALAVDEEFEFGGAEALLAEGIDAEAIIIGEPTGLRLVTTHKGSIRWWVECQGRAVHSAQPHLGVNAISAAMALIAGIDGPYKEALSRREAPLLGSPTVSVAQIEGGVQANLVPDRCRIQLDRRTIPGETTQGVLAEFEALFEGARRRFPDFRARLEKPTLDAPAMATDPAHPIVAQAAEAARAIGLAGEPVGVDYATDACILARSGKPVIVTGPGNIGQAHTADEFIELGQLETGARLFASLMGMPLPQ